MSASRRQGASDFGKGDRRSWSTDSRLISLVVKVEESAAPDDKRTRADQKLVMLIGLS